MKPGTPRKAMTKEERQLILNLYAEGKSAQEISKLVDRGFEHINRIAKEAGISRSRWPRPLLSKEELTILYLGRKLTPQAIGELYSTSACKVRTWLRNYGIDTRKVKAAAEVRAGTITVQEVDKISGLYAKGLSSRDISLEIGRNERVVRQCLARRGLTRSRADGVRNAVAQGKMKIVGLTLKETFFETWTPESAWVLGLLYGDGNVWVRPEKSQYVVTLAGSKEVCEKVGRLLNPASTVRKMKKAECWIIRWHSKRLVESLSKLGLSGGSKARSIRMPKVPDHLLGHFFRGLWDADGHWITSEGRGRPSTVIQLASEGMIDDLKGFLGGRKSQGVKNLNGKEFNWFSLNLRVEETDKFIRIVYPLSSETCLRCSRKAGEALAGIS